MNLIQVAEIEAFLQMKQFSLTDKVEPPQQKLFAASLF